VKSAPPIEAGTGSFAADRVTLAYDYRVAEAETRAPVVLLHGAGQTRHSWRRVADRLLGSGRSVITIDGRGHGDSSWDPGLDYTWQAFAADLTAFLRRLDRPAVLVGASLGGITALLVAGAEPQMVSALVMVDIVIAVESEGSRRIHDFMTSRPEGFGSLDEVADAIAVFNPSRPRPSSFDGLRRNLRRREDGRWVWHWDPALMEDGRYSIRRVDPELVGEAAARVEAPTLIVRGLDSEVVSEAGLADMVERLPHAAVADVSAAGHMVAGDDNDVFGATLEDFLQNLP
jgi:non-heme chloroperoxidase